MALDIPKLIGILREAGAEVDDHAISTEAGVREFLLARSPERIENALLDLVGSDDAEFVAAAARELRQVTGPTARPPRKDAERHAAQAPTYSRDAPPLPPTPLVPPEPGPRQANVQMTAVLLIYFSLQAGADLVRQGKLVEAHAAYTYAVEIYAKHVKEDNLTATPTLYLVAAEGILVVTDIVLNLALQIDPNQQPGTLERQQSTIQSLVTRLALSLDTNRDTGDMAMLRSLGPIALIAELTQLEAEHTFHLATDRKIENATFGYPLALIYARNAEGWFAEELRQHPDLAAPAQDFLRNRVALAYRLGRTIHPYVYNPPPAGSVDPVALAGTTSYFINPALSLGVRFAFLMLQGINVPIVVAQPARPSIPRVELAVPQSGPVLADLIDIWFSVEQAMSDIESGKLLQGIQLLDKTSVRLTEIANQEAQKRNIPCALVAYMGSLLLMEEVQKTWGNQAAIRAHFQATGRAWSEEIYGMLARSMAEKALAYRNRVDELSRMPIPGLPSEEELRRFEIDGIFMDLFLHTAQLNQSYARWVEETNPGLSVQTLGDVIGTLHFAAAKSGNILRVFEASLTPHTGNYLLAVFQQSQREARRAFERLQALGHPEGPVQLALPADQIPAFRAIYRQTLPMASARFEMFEDEMQQDPILRTESSIPLVDFEGTNWWLASSLTQLGEVLQGSIVIDPEVFNPARTRPLRTAFLLVRPDGTRIGVDFSDVQGLITFRVDPQAFADNGHYLRLEEDTVARINAVRTEPPFVGTDILIFSRNDDCYVYERNQAGVFEHVVPDTGTPGGSAAPASDASETPTPQGNPGGSQTKGVMNHAPTKDIRALLIQHGFDLDAYAYLLDADVVGPELQAEALTLLNRTDIDPEQMQMDLQQLIDESVGAGSKPARLGAASSAPTRMAHEPMAARLMTKI